MSRRTEAEQRCPERAQAAGGRGPDRRGFHEPGVAVLLRGLPASGGLPSAAAGTVSATRTSTAHIDAPANGGRRHRSHRRRRPSPGHGPRPYRHQGEGDSATRRDRGPAGRLGLHRVPGPRATHPDGARRPAPPFSGRPGSAPCPGGSPRGGRCGPDQEANARVTAVRAPGQDGVRRTTGPPGGRSSTRPGTVGCSRRRARRPARGRQRPVPSGQRTGRRPSAQQSAGRVSAGRVHA